MNSPSEFILNSPSEFGRWVKVPSHRGDNTFTEKFSRQPESLQITGSFQLFCVKPCSRHYDEIAKKSEFCSIKTKVQKYLFKHFQDKSLF